MLTWEYSCDTVFNAKPRAAGISPNILIEWFASIWDTITAVGKPATGSKYWEKVTTLRIRNIKTDCFN